MKIRLLGRYSATLREIVLWGMGLLWQGGG